MWGFFFFWGGGGQEVHITTSNTLKQTHTITLFFFLLTNLVLHFEGNVKLEDNQHELEPGTHLSVGQWNVDCKHNVVGLDSLGHGLIKVSDLAALVGAPRHEPLGALMMGLHSVHTLGGQVMDGSGGARSYRNIFEYRFKNSFGIKNNVLIRMFCT